LWWYHSFSFRMDACLYILEIRFASLCIKFSANMRACTHTHTILLSCFLLPWLLRWHLERSAFLTLLYKPKQFWRYECHEISLFC
jgi:hypothetical protein